MFKGFSKLFSPEKIKLLQRFHSKASACKRTAQLLPGPASAMPSSMGKEEPRDLHLQQARRHLLVFLLWWLPRPPHRLVAIEAPASVRHHCSFSGPPLPSPPSSTAASPSSWAAGPCLLQAPPMAAHAVSSFTPSRPVESRA
jgi:hypothetical protein